MDSQTEQSSINDKFDFIGNLSQSQKDRLDIDSLIKYNLFEFLRAKISRVSNGSSLKRTVEAEILNRIEDKEDKVRVSDLIRLYEALSSNQVEEEGQLIDLLKQNSKTDGSGTGGGKSIPASEYSVEDIESAKSALTSYNKLLSNPAIKHLMESSEENQSEKSAEEKSSETD
jgi:hypothetical protein